MKKNYFITLIVIVGVLLIVNIFFLLNNRGCTCVPNVEQKTENIGSSCYVSKKLDLDKEQSAEYDIIKKKHQAVALRAIDSLHVSQEILMDYLASNSDDTKVEELENKITEFQKILLRQHIEQYQDLKAILKPSQVDSMNKLFKDLFVCKPSCEHTSEGCATNHK